MKKNILYSAFLIFVILAITSCEKDSEGVSRITNHAVIKMNGSELMTVKVGQPYVDPGAVAHEDTTEITVKVTNGVDANTVGLYYVTYSAVNSDGYSRSSLRTVIVMPLVVPTDDLSGKYKRNAGKNGVSEWTKIEDGLYKVTDVGGALLLNDYVYVLNTEPNIVVVPLQAIGGNGDDIYCDNGSDDSKIVFTPGPIGIGSYAWRVINSGYGAAVRTFIKTE